MPDFEAAFAWEPRVGVGGKAVAVRCGHVMASKSTSTRIVGGYPLVWLSLGRIGASKWEMSDLYDLRVKWFF